MMTTREEAIEVMAQAYLAFVRQYQKDHYPLTSTIADKCGALFDALRGSGLLNDQLERVGWWSPLTSRFYGKHPGDGSEMVPVFRKVDVPGETP